MKLFTCFLLLILCVFVFSGCQSGAPVTQSTSFHPGPPENPTFSTQTTAAPTVPPTTAAPTQPEIPTTSTQLEPPPPPPELTGLSWQEAVIAIKQWEHGRYDVRVIFDEYGSYGDKIVAFVFCYDEGVFGIMGEETLGGLEFRYRDSLRLTVYQEGSLELMTLKEAWEAGLFTQAELSAIHSLYVEKNGMLYTEE